MIFNLVLGVGKTSLVHLILKGASISRPSQTVGCTVGVKVIHCLSSVSLRRCCFCHCLLINLLLSYQHISYGSASSSSNIINVDSQRDFFIELWDVSGHERYKDCRSLFYREINGTYAFSFSLSSTEFHFWRHWFHERNISVSDMNGMVGSMLILVEWWFNERISYKCLVLLCKFPYKMHE